MFGQCLILLAHVYSSSNITVIVNIKIFIQQKYVAMYVDILGSRQFINVASHYQQIFIKVKSGNKISVVYTLKVYG